MFNSPRAPLLQATIQQSNICEFITFLSARSIINNNKQRLSLAASARGCGGRLPAATMAPGGRARWHVESVSARAFKTFHEVEVKLPSSRLVSLEGANGCGKTNLLEAVCLCLAPGCPPATLRARELKELICSEGADVRLGASASVGLRAQRSLLQFAQQQHPHAILPRALSQLCEVRVRIFDGLSTRHEVFAGLTPEGTRVYKLDARLKTAAALRVRFLCWGLQQHAQHSGKTHQDPPQTTTTQQNPPNNRTSCARAAC